MNETVEHLLEMVGLALLKVGAAWLMRKRATHEKPKEIICVEVPAELTDKEGCTIEVHWLGARRVAGTHHIPPPEKPQ